MKRGAEFQGRREGRFLGVLQDQRRQLRQWDHNWHLILGRPAWQGLSMSMTTRSARQPSQPASPAEHDARPRTRFPEVEEDRHAVERGVVVLRLAWRTALAAVRGKRAVIGAPRPGQADHLPLPRLSICRV